MFINDIPPEYRHYGYGLAHVVMYLRYNLTNLEPWFLQQYNHFVLSQNLVVTTENIFTVLNSFWRYQLSYLTNLHKLDTTNARLSLRDDLLNNVQNWLYNFEMNIVPLLRDNIESIISNGVTTHVQARP